MLNPLTIGPVTIEMPVFAAPLSGVTDLPFRRALKRAGAPVVVSEMVASAELARGAKDAVRRSVVDAEGGPFIIQLAGRDPYWMGEGARLAEGLGADIIDINMGCPARSVVGQACGSALMTDLDLALSIIEATIAATRRPVTLKMRLGWDDKSRNAPELARRAEAAGIALITVHGRTRCQFYDGKADWSAVSLVKQAVNLPVIVNGDIVDEASARAALAQSGADGVMVGRGLYGRPWFPSSLGKALLTKAPVTPPSALGVLESLLQLYRDNLDFHGRRHGIKIARKHLAWTIDATDLAMDDLEKRTFRATIARMDDPEDVEAALISAFTLKPLELAA